MERALKEMEEGRRERNQAARGIAAKKSGNKEEADKIMAQVKDLGERIAALDDKANSLLEERDQIRMRIPNLLHSAVPVGEMNQATLNIPCTEISRSLSLNREPITNSLK